jgi:Protein of unknown function (DUF1569)
VINTKKVKDRRHLRFENFAAALQDADALADAEHRGALRATGNWTLGQSLGHLGFWARAPFDGYPPMPRPPFFLRLLAPLIKNRILNQGMVPGIRIGRVEGGTFGTEVVPTQRALDELRKAYDRLTARDPGVANPFFGSLSHENWIKLNLRHAELHQSFFHPL